MWLHIIKTTDNYNIIIYTDKEYVFDEIKTIYKFNLLTFGTYILDQISLQNEVLFRDVNTLFFKSTDINSVVSIVENTINITNNIIPKKIKSREDIIKKGNINEYKEHYTYQETDFALSIKFLPSSKQIFEYFKENKFQITHDVLKDTLKDEYVSKITYLKNENDTFTFPYKDKILYNHWRMIIQNIINELCCIDKNSHIKAKILFNLFKDYKSDDIQINDCIKNCNRLLFPYYIESLQFPKKRIHEGNIFLGIKIN